MNLFLYISMKYCASCNGLVSDALDVCPRCESRSFRSERRVAPPVQQDHIDNAGIRRQKRPRASSVVELGEQISSVVVQSHHSELSASVGASFGSAVRQCLNKYATFSGRAKRSEFWWWLLFVLLLGISSNLISQSLANIVFLALLLPTLAVTTRRLHDTNRSGWYQLLCLLPLIGFVIFLFCLQSSKEPNKFSN